MTLLTHHHHKLLKLHLLQLHQLRNLLKDLNLVHHLQHLRQRLLRRPKNLKHLNKHQLKLKDHCMKHTSSDLMQNTIWSKLGDKGKRPSKWKRLNKMPLYSEILWPRRMLRMRNKQRIKLILPPALQPERKPEKTKKKPTKEKLIWLRQSVINRQSARRSKRKRRMRLIGRRNCKSRLRRPKASQSLLKPQKRSQMEGRGQ